MSSTNAGKKVSQVSAVDWKTSPPRQVSHYCNSKGSQSKDPEEITLVILVHSSAKLCFTTGIWQIQITQILANRRHCIDRHSKSVVLSLSQQFIFFFSFQSCRNTTQQLFQNKNLSFSSDHFCLLSNYIKHHATARVHADTFCKICRLYRH